MSYNNNWSTEDNKVAHDKDVRQLAKVIGAEIGDVRKLNYPNIVMAIRALINDDETANNSTWSSTKIDTQISRAITDLINGADEDHDTLKELADKIVALSQADVGLVSATQPQSFSREQQKLARENIDAVSYDDVQNITESVASSNTVDVDLPLNYNSAKVHDNTMRVTSVKRVTDFQSLHETYRNAVNEWFDNPNIVMFTFTYVGHPSNPPTHDYDYDSIAYDGIEITTTFADGYIDENPPNGVFTLSALIPANNNAIDYGVLLFDSDEFYNLTPEMFATLHMKIDGVVYDEWGGTPDHTDTTVSGEYVKRLTTTIAKDIGPLRDLTVKDSKNLVAAINEVDAKVTTTLNYDAKHVDYTAFYNYGKKSPVTTTL